MTTWSVDTRAELDSAIAAAKGGDTIVLASGSYGDVVISNRNFDSTVSIQSADENNPATFNSIKITNSSNITVDSVHVSNPGNGSEGGAFFRVEDSSHITLQNSEINGSVDNNSNGAYGVGVWRSSDVTITGNDIHHVNHGVANFSTSDSEVSENTFNYLGSDSMKFGGVNGMLIENNTNLGTTIAVPDAHIDFIQFQGSSSNVEIRGNVLLMSESNDKVHQGIFIKDGSYSDFLIEQNLIYTNTVNGIYLEGNSGTGDITIRNNTVLSNPDETKWNSANIRIVASDGPVLVENNITDDVQVSSSGVTQQNNIELQFSNPSASDHYSKYFANATEGSNATIEDFAPVPGSAADGPNGMGAAGRIDELLHGGGPIDENDAPIAVDDAWETTEGRVLAFNVATNDRDPDGDSLSVELLGDASHGTVMINANGVGTYTPDDDFTGTDQFTYKLSDGKGGFDEATVSITVLEGDVKPTPSGSLFTLTGPATFDRPSDVIIVDSDKDFETDTYAVALTFNADDVSGMHGLVSKDAYGFGDGGHFSAFIADGELIARFQSDSEQAMLSLGKVSAGQDYNFFATYSDGVASVYLDGERKGATSIDASWMNNKEVLQVGALGWSSDSGEDSFTRVFDGTIKNLRIMDSVPGAGGGNPDPDPDPDPETPDPVFQFKGPLDVGSSSDVVVLAHDDALELDAATVSLTFNADSVSGSHGILSKDAKGFGDGGHFTAYIKDGELIVRFQNTTAEKAFTVDGIAKGEDYHLVATFGDGSVAVYLDGKLVGSANFQTSWMTNEEYMQIGGNGWASAPGESSFVNAFDGVISDVEIFDQKADADLLDALDGGVVSDQLIDIQSHSIGLEDFL